MLFCLYSAYYDGIAVAQRTKKGVSGCKGNIILTIYLIDKGKNRRKPLDLSKNNIICFY